MMRSDSKRQLELEAATQFVVDATRNGTLEQAPAASAAPVAKPSQQDCAALRQSACDVFLLACNDGTLKTALLEVAQARPTTQRAAPASPGRVLPGAQAQTELSWANAPSVGPSIRRLPSPQLVPQQPKAAEEIQKSKALKEMEIAELKARVAVLEESLR